MDKRFKRIPYKAHSTDKSKRKQTRLDIRRKDGTGWIITYSYITRIRYTEGSIISLVCPDCIITMKGERLREMVGLLHDEKLRYIQEFGEGFEKPAGDDPVVESMTVTEREGREPQNRPQERT